MSIRLDRANSEIREKLAYIIQNKMNDPRVRSLIYVSEVNVTPDFKYCKVKIALDSNDPSVPKEVLKTLQKSEGFIKRELAASVKMPSVPKLTFEIDKGTAASVRVNELLKTLNIPKDEGNE